ncbi:MAG TPA: hypothetical protein VEY67_06055 [Candidatus Dormibacteraeota bacterium]|nr:hypothetical protein [Candidatus Dormibacteraeota bacterium]
MDAAWAAESRLTPDAAEFVRFCYRRRKVGWPELYDEMCAVASRGLFRGVGPEDLSKHGIGFGLFELPALAALVARIVAEEPRPERERRSARPGVVPVSTRERSVADERPDDRRADEPSVAFEPRLAPAAS